MITDLTTNKDLPKDFTNWFDFYQRAKYLVPPGYDKFEYVSYERPRSIIDTMKPEPVHTHHSVYSIRYIERQTLAELIEQREKQTFSKRQLELLREAITNYGYHSEPGSYLDLGDLQQKVTNLIIHERKKEVRR